jgi:hypothetical protein
MTSGGVEDRERITAVLDALDAATRAVVDLTFDALTPRELVAVLARLEAVDRRTPTTGHRIIARLDAEAAPTDLGATSLREVLVGELRISRADAQRRIADAKTLGPRKGLTGQRLEPLLPRTAAAQAAGRIGADHVAAIRRFFDQLPQSIDVTTREQAEETLVCVATELGPDDLRKAAERLAYLIDQDGPMPDDAERARKRGVTIGRQGPDGMSEIKGLLDPQARATFEAITAKWAAPGMCNPDDPSPCSSGTPTQAQIDGDTRDFAQRTHDALTAIGRSVLTSGELGQHNGLPATIIVSTTLAELESAAGVAATGGDSVLPMSDVIRMAAHAHHYLAIFDTHTHVPLYLGRTKRCASVGQRVMLHARDRGCTKPGCTVPGYGCQVHHIEGWARHDGLTNIDVEVLACGPHNRLAEQDGWHVRIQADGTVAWIPPPHLDHGQPRTNGYHHPNRMLKDPEPDAGGPDVR